MSQIRIPYDEVHNVANEFSNQATTIQSAIESLNKRAEQLVQNWEGVAEQAFMQELESCRIKLAHTPEMLNQISQALHRTATDIQAAEQQASSQINSTISSNS